MDKVEIRQDSGIGWMMGMGMGMGTEEDDQSLAFILR